MNNQILKTACCMMMTRRTPLVGVRGVFLYAADGTTIVDEKMSFADNSLTPGQLLKVYSRGSSINTAVNSGKLYVYSGGIATGAQLIQLNTNTYNGGLYVYSGGVAEDVFVKVLRNNTLCMFVMDGGVANNCTTEGGTIAIETGGVANDCIATAFTGGYTRIILVNSGGIANNSVIRGTQNVYGTSNDTEIYDNIGTENVDSGGVSNRTKVFKAGTLNVLDGGVANDATIYNDAYLHVFAGGAAYNVFKDSRAQITVDAGGIITYRSVE